MYITLDVKVRRYEDYGGYLKIDLSNLPKPEFMPTKLVRIPDMAVIDGSQMNEGYCALSYSWNQSGEILQDEATGKYKRIDKGKHKINSYFHTMCADAIVPKYMTYDNDKLKKVYNVLKIMYGSTYIDKIEYVKFEGIIQHICQQLNIKYIWYDQMCINQKDKEEKHREIRNMHHIYSNAFCTIAFVPECKYVNSQLGIEGEEYFKRLWTLEEAIKSDRLLFVGSDVYRWSKKFESVYDNIKILNKPLSKISVAQILYHAHQRTSTKEHDRVFALIQLFPEFMQHIDIDYDQPFEELMVQFYGLLAKKDFSILLFGNISNYISYNSTIQKYKFLPSWTGVNGKHIIIDNVATSFRNYDIIGKTMNVTSKFVTNDQDIDNDALTIQIEDLPPLPVDIKHSHNELYYCLCTRVQLPGSSETRNVSLFDSFFNIVYEECVDEISRKLKRLSRFMKPKKENLYWHHRKREEYQKVIDINFEHLTEDFDNLSAQYIILSEVLFKSEYSDFFYPVIKKKHGEEYYKAIGCLEIDTNIDIFSGCNLPKQTFSIQ